MALIVKGHGFKFFKFHHTEGAQYEGFKYHTHKAGWFKFRGIMAVNSTIVRGVTLNSIIIKGCGSMLCHCQGAWLSIL